MRHPKGTKTWRNGVLFWLVVLFCSSRIFAALPPDSLAINSISADGTNLEFVATFPPGIAQAVLEMRPTLTDEWQSAASLNVPATGGTIDFAIPMPALASAFFRLNVARLAATQPGPPPNPALRTNAQFSAELQYVVVPPLGPDPTNAAEAVFHFKGMIDGSDRISINHQGALWEHVNWGWPAGAVTVNGSQWNPSEKNYITTTGAVLFLPEKYSLAAARLDIITNRDVLTLERTNDALMVYLNDTPPGAASYEFKIHFPRARTRPKPVHASSAATLIIAAQIDGSDVLKITRREATWTHQAWAYPDAVRLNNIPWDVRQTNTLMNAGTNTFLPSDVDFSTAKIVRRQGRDLATLWADADAMWVTFADNPNGADAYELEISFGPESPGGRREKTFNLDR